MISELDNRPFCDWFACSQVHNSDVPVFLDAVISCADTDGVLRWKSQKGYSHPGSWDTSILINSDGRRVSISGNPGRFNRPDNVFGISLNDTKKKVNEILASMGLPPFTGGHCVDVPLLDGKGDVQVSLKRGGARISQIHLTQNYSTGSSRALADFLYWLGSQKIGNTANSVYANSVYFGSSSFALMKVYGKSEEIKRTMKRLARRELVDAEQMKHLSYLKQLQEWAESTGLLRFEIEFKSRYLTQQDVYAWDTCTDETLKQHYGNYQDKFMERIEINADITELPIRARSYYYAYMAGVNLKNEGMGASTFRRYRKILLTCGIDIAKELNVQAINIKPRVIELRPAVMPEFYQRPEVGLRIVA